jgi:L-glutamine-phosphate cytidylyltransferase
MRAIIIAAGMGRRLVPHTNDRPKCMVDIRGQTILERQAEAYRASGVDELHVVRGYCADSVKLAGCHFHDNPDYARNNILSSMFCAEAAMEGGFCFSYSDILFTREVVAHLVAQAADYALIVDRRWADTYVGRTLHQPGEAELTRVEGDRVVRVGKRLVVPAEARGEFIGLARFSARAARRMQTEYHRLLEERGLAAPFGTAPRLETAYLTDLLNHLIDQGEVMTSVDIDGGWREIDTPEDLERARQMAW